MEEETIDARLKMLLEKSEDVLGQRKIDESYQSVDEDVTSDTSVTSDYGPNEQVQQRHASSKDAVQDNDGIQSSDEEQNVPESSSTPTPTFNPSPLFKSEKHKDVASSQFNFSDQDLDKYST